MNLLKNNTKMKMSKRSGNYITMREVLKEVGVDAIRFIMVSRNADKKIDFDLDVFLKKTKIILCFIYNMLMRGVHL